MVEAHCLVQCHVYIIQGQSFREFFSFERLWEFFEDSFDRVIAYQLLVVLVDSIVLVVVFFQISFNVFEEIARDWSGSIAFCREWIVRLLDLLSSDFLLVDLSFDDFERQSNIKLNLLFEEVNLWDLHDFFCPLHVSCSALRQEVVSSEPLSEDLRNGFARVIGMVSELHGELSMEALLPIDESHLSVLISEENVDLLFKIFVFLDVFKR